LSKDALDEAKKQGADHIVNPMEDLFYIQAIKTITGKGCHAAINFTNSIAAYASMPELLRPNGLLMVTGIPQKPLSFPALAISMKRYRIRGSNNGITPQLEKCLEFSEKFGIRPKVEQFKLGDVPRMVEMMDKGESRGRLGIVFD